MTLSVGGLLLLLLVALLAIRQRRKSPATTTTSREKTFHQSIDGASGSTNVQAPAPANSSPLWPRSNSDELSRRLGSYDLAVNQMLKQHSGGNAGNVSSPYVNVTGLGGTREFKDAAQRSSYPQSLYQPADAKWKTPADAVTVAGIRISGGLFYVGKALPRQIGYGPDNCLINPDLPVASATDSSGLYLDYWPSYSLIHPSSRRTYLQWLASSRSDPATPIGYVFLYFYGIERRLMLDAAATDERPILIAEVRRLLEVYGGNHSFSRYANALFSAESLITGDALSSTDIRGQGYEVPFSLLAALGVRAKQNRPVEPELLWAFARAHPETRVRTPVQRVPEEHRELFSRTIAQLYPRGVFLTDWSRLPKLEARYRAASASFEIDLLPPSNGLPDVTTLGEPMTSVRRLFESCSDQLDRYSRELGRAKGMKPTLATIARLPREMRLTAAAQMPGKPIERLAAFANANTATDLQDLANLLGIELSVPASRGDLRELAGTLGALGFGVTNDPDFVLRKPKPDAPVNIFSLEEMLDETDAPSEAFRLAQVTLALGRMAAEADGTLTTEEAALLSWQILEASVLSPNERRRLLADLRSSNDGSLTLSELRGRLKQTSPGVRRELAQSVINLALADGRVDGREVAFIEKLFRQIDLDTDEIYSRLHSGLTENGTSAPTSGLLSVASTVTTAVPVVPKAVPPDPGTSGSRKAETDRIDMQRLAAIRAETASTAAILASIFTEEDDAVSEALQSPTKEADVAIDGLDRRHHAVLLELTDRTEWSKVEFDQLIRAAGLMPGAALNAINEWALDRFDEILLEGDDTIQVHRSLLPAELLRENA